MINPHTRDLVLRCLKTDLHCHLDGSLRLSTILDLAKEQGVSLAAQDEEGLARSIHMGEICDDLVDYLWPSASRSVSCKRTGRLSGSPTN